MLSNGPDYRSRKVLSNLHLALVSSIFILFVALTAVVLSTTSAGTHALLITIFLTTSISSFLELGIMVCARRFFRANAFLQKGYRSLLNYECSYALYSLPNIIISLIWYVFSTCSSYLNPSPGLAQIPEICSSFVFLYYISFVLGPLVFLVLLTFFLVNLAAAYLLIWKIATLVSGASKSQQGEMMKYPLSIMFVQ